MINSSGSSRNAECVFGKAGASAAFTLTVSRGECWTRVFDFDGILGVYNGIMLCLKHSFLYR